MLIIPSTLVVNSQIKGVLTATAPHGLALLHTTHLLLPHCEKVAKSLSQLAPHLPVILKNKDAIMPEVQVDLAISMCFF